MTAGADSLLASMNAPPLIAAFGVVAAACLPALERACIGNVVTPDNASRSPLLPWPVIKYINVCIYALNYYAVSQPGRIDGRRSQTDDNNDDRFTMPSKELSNKQKRSAIVAKSTATTITKSSSSQRRGNKLLSHMRERSLLAPDGWAFAIWAPIFAGELLYCLASIMLPESASIVPILKQVSAGFWTAQIFQILWAASFRPKYIKWSTATVTTTAAATAATVTTISDPAAVRGVASAWHMWISSLMLTGIAASLSRAHVAYSTTSSASTMNRFLYVIFCLPLTLHFGWTTAACLVNWNGNAAVVILHDDNNNNNNIGHDTTQSIKSIQSARRVALIGHASAVLATVVGVVVTWTRLAPLYGGVIAWALAACATAMQRRIVTIQQQQQQYDVNDDQNKSNLRSQPGYWGAVTQKWICTIGALITCAASLTVVLLSFRGSSEKEF